MIQNAISYNFENHSFLIDYLILQDLTEEAKQTLLYLFEQYKQIQDELHLKFPFSNYIKVAKIEKIISKPNGLNIQYYYDGLDGEKFEISYIDQQSIIDEGFRLAFPLALNQQDLKNFDITNLKSVLFNLIEIFYWSANCGLFFDPFKDNLYYQKESELFLFLPTFSLIVRYLFQSQEKNTEQKFLDFRCKLYQNATYNFLSNFYQEFQSQLKDQDEDLKFFQENLSKNNNFNVEQDLLKIVDESKGVDFLHKEEKIKKKQPRYIFKQSMLLYQLQNNKKLLETFRNFNSQDSLIINGQSKEKSSSDNIQKQILSNSMEETLLKQFTILTGFFNGLTQEFNSESSEIFGKFMSKIHEYLLSNKIAEDRKDWIPFNKVSNNKHKVKVLKNEKNLFEFTWSSLINRVYRPLTSINQQQMAMNNANNQQQISEEDLQINYLFECNQSNIIIKLIISQIQFSIDTADDLMYLSNMIAKEPTAINIYVDESRRLTLQTSITLVAPMEIFKIAIKIFDILQIYYHMILDFYLQNIQLGRLIKENKFKSFVKEIIHYVSEYEIDFDEQMKKTQEQNQQQSQQ
ncbi:unnamed protein product [Paramecium sonneborni]|uniref:Uncharacterized protein n=1 Tax=Paramecium sonneborni TaxID=65129 RepID=A0A8S1QNX7_9CILI|nr:unnamed protein product [Paramecium sonneborni]